MKKIYIIYLPLILLNSCSHYQFIDNKSSYKEWNFLPMNGRYLKIEMVDSTTSRKLPDKLYFITPYRGEKKSVINSLAELDTKTNIMNIFPLPSNKSKIDLTKDNLFPPPTVILKGLRITAEYSQDIGYFSFKTYPIVYGASYIKDTIPINEKKVIIDFNKKKGILIDTTNFHPRGLW